MGRESTFARPQGGAKPQAAHAPSARPPATSPIKHVKSSAPAPKAPQKHARPTDWSEIADWYDNLVGDEGSEYHQKVIFPGILRLLQVSRGDQVLDVACGQGALARLLASRGATVVGVDSAEPLIAAARQRGGAGHITYHVGDVRELERMPFIPAGQFKSAVCVLAMQNFHPIAPVFAGVARALQPGGTFTVVMMHPCFRGPKETHWGWDAEAGVQFRRVDRYLVPRKSPIVTHPGSDPGAYTWTFHKPIEAYVKAARSAGLLIDALEEWPSHKTSQPGPRAAAENTAREEIPMFMAIRAVKALIPSTGTPGEG
jgi:ubiquinone/menaquinone biosynthesis C-methylase UbiE